MGRAHDVVISGFDLDALERELNEMTLRWEQTNDALFNERALADRLADALTNPSTYVALEALAAWKEARSE